MIIRYQLVIIALIYLIAWQVNLLIYALLLTLPYIYTRIRAPAYPWQKTLVIGLFLSITWYLTNALAMLSLVPIGELGFFKAVQEIFTDLIKHRELPGLAFTYPLYRTRLLTSFIAITGLSFAIIQTPFGRGLGLHKFLNMPGDYRMSENTTQGSARWSTEPEIRTFLKSTGDGTILGKNENNDPLILPIENKFEFQRNQNIAIFGTTGSGKSASFVKPNILQADTSFVITDPKQELYHSMSGYLRNRGYDVYKFNLVNMEDSNHWNPLMKKDGTYEFAVEDAVLMASSIIKNSRDPSEKKGDAFWDDSQTALLTALILYATKHFTPDHSDPEKRYNPTFADILRFATHRPASALDFDFAHIPKDDPAFSSYSVYKQANENVRSSIMISLGVSLQLFQDNKLARLTSRSDFDFTDLGKKKTAIFVVISDSNSTYNCISALFFIQAFQELYKLAEKESGTLPVPVRFIMDEFCNIGYIPDYTVKLSTMRSRGIFAQMIIQSLKQLENRYPDGLAAEIIGNSDTRIMMGANDPDTAEYFSEMIGKSTVEQQTHNRSDKVAIDAGNISYRELGRQLITPDEILRLKNKEQIILLRGTYPIRSLKMYYEEHPNAHLLTNPAPGQNIHTLTNPISKETHESSLLKKIEQAQKTITITPNNHEPDLSDPEVDNINIPQDKFDM